MESRLIEVSMESGCTLSENTYMSRFGGCQCTGDCDCYEDWKAAGNPKEVTFYAVSTGRRTHRCNTIVEARELMDKISKSKRGKK